MAAATTRTTGRTVNTRPYSSLISCNGNIGVEKLDVKAMHSENSTGVGSGSSATRLEDPSQMGRTKAGHNATDDVSHDAQTLLRGIGAHFLH